MTAHSLHLAQNGGGRCDCGEEFVGTTEALAAWQVHTEAAIRSLLELGVTSRAVSEAIGRDDDGTLGALGQHVCARSLEQVDGLPPGVPDPGAATRPRRARPEPPTEAASMNPEPIGFLCTHGHAPEVVSPGFQCSAGGDEPVYEGDTVHTTVTYVKVGTLNSGMRLTTEWTARVERAPS